MRLIDADALKEWIDEYVSVFKKSDIKDIKGYIEHQPTIEPKRGEWVPFDLTWGRSVWYCTACEEGVEVPCDIWEHKPIYKYCPNCGAKMADRKTENSSEKPNNCEHITEDGVTCAKYPACDDCPDNPLNKVKGSERLVKGSEKETEIERLDRIDSEIEDAWARIRELTTADTPQTEREE